jgi:anti-sigma regulatory factor (Ser/Thr protein kinase)
MPILPESTMQMQLRADLSELHRMNVQVEVWGNHLQVPKNEIFRTQFLLEELFVNAITHGQQEGRTMWATLTLTAQPDGVDIEWIDNGLAFNPLESPNANADASLDERSPGGWGLTMLRQLCSQAQYQRKTQTSEEVNCLRLTLIWSST